MEKINPLDQERLLGRRIGRIEDRPDLFETKLLFSKKEELPREESKNILVCTRDPGSANALIPVVERIKERASFYFLTDGWARNSIEQKFKTEDLSPSESMLLAYEAMPEPDLILTDPSSSERGLENYAAGTFPQSPLVLVEDYYGVANNALRRLKEIKKEPARVCVMDRFAREIVLKENPEFGG